MSKVAHRSPRKRSLLDCEELFCQNRFEESWDALQNVEPNEDTKSRIGALGIQSLGALERKDEVDAFVNKICGEDKQGWDPTLLRIWVQFVLWTKSHTLQELSEILNGYLGTHKDNLKEREYALISELLIFHILVKQEKFEQAKVFLEVNQFLELRTKHDWRVRLQAVESEVRPDAVEITSQTSVISLPSKELSTTDKFKLFLQRIYERIGGMAYSKYAARWLVLIFILFLLWKKGGSLKALALAIFLKIQNQWKQIVS